MILALALLACTSPPETGDTALQAEGELEAEAQVSELIPTVVTVSWDSGQDGTSWVEYGLDGALDERTPEVSGSTEVQRSLLGLKAGHTYSWQAVTELSDGTQRRSQVGQVDLEPIPAGMVPLTVQSIDPQQQLPGGYIITNLVQPEGSWAVILDRDGDYVWWLAGPEGQSSFNAELSADRRTLIYYHTDREQVQDLAGLTRVDLVTGEEVHTRTPMGHHDFELLPEGDVAWLGLDIREVDIDGTPWTVAGDTIMETHEGADEEGPFTQVFNFFDDYADPWIHNDFFFVEAYNTGAQDWSHTNSLIYLAQEDAYFTLSRHLDTMLKIDRSSREVVWEMGGDRNMFTPVGEVAWWSGGHTSQIWDGGAVIFDNGDKKSPRVSRAVELAWDEESRTVQEVWSFTEPRGRYSLMGGDARKLDNGNVLVAWTSQGLFTEVTPDGEVVWTAETGLGAALWRVHWTESLYPSE